VFAARATFAAVVVIVAIAARTVVVVTALARSTFAALGLNVTFGFGKECAH
jgi:hypothetical protein